MDDPTRHDAGAAVHDGPATATEAQPIAPLASVPTERVQAARPGSGPRSRLRWGIASLVTVLAVATSAAGFAVLSAGAATSALAGYVPDGSVGYLEIRMDAPGDQRQNAANLLSHFPGFADQSTLGTKLDEALDQIVGRASAGSQTFTGDVRAWLGDSVAVVVTRVPFGSISGTRTHAAAGLLLVSVREPETANAWARTTLGPGTASETYAGIALTSVDRGGHVLQFGVAGNVLLMGDPDSVHAAIDTNGRSAFASTASFTAATSAVPGDRLAFGYLDMAAVAQAAQAAWSTASGGPKWNLDHVPAWVAVSIRAAADSLSAAVALPSTGREPATSNHASVLAADLPPGTVAAGEIHDLAAILGFMTATIQEQAAAGDAPDQVDEALRALERIGGIDGLAGWMGDATAAVIRTQGAFDLAGGILVRATDAATATTRLAQIKNLVSLAGGAAGISMSDEDYHGTTITVIDAGPVARASGGRSIAGIASGQHLTIAIAQKGELVVAGVGDAFVKAVIDTTPGASLADQAGYRNAIAQAGVTNNAQLYVDLSALLDVATSRLPADALKRFQADIKPYVDPFHAFAVSGSAGDPNRARFVVTVK